MAETGVLALVLSLQGPRAEGDSTSTTLLPCVARREPVQRVQVAHFCSLLAIWNGISLVASFSNARSSGLNCYASGPHYPMPQPANCEIRVTFGSVANQHLAEVLSGGS